MSEKDVVEYKKHKLVVRPLNGVFKGRVYDPYGTVLVNMDVSSFDEGINLLRDFVDAQVSEKAKGRTSFPEVSECVRAFQKILADLPDSYLAMLRAHYQAKDKTITTTQLAQAGNYQNWNAAALHYGLLGKRLHEYLPIELPTRPDGSEIMTFTLATAGDLTEDEGHWQWVMRPEVSAAIESLGLDR